MPLAFLNLTPGCSPLVSDAGPLDRSKVPLGQLNHEKRKQAESRSYEHQG
jgi:hypothetical protein